MNEQNVPSIGHYEPSMSMTILRACSNCRGKHPLAYDPPLPPDRCPSCGAPVIAPESRTVETATLTDGRTRIGNLLMRVGQKLHRLALRM